MDYHARKNARRAAFAARFGKPQPRRVFRVYVNSLLDVGLPVRFATTPVGSFWSRAEAERFVCPYGPGTLFGPPAYKALMRMLTRDEDTRLTRGFEHYLTFTVSREFAP